QPSLYLSHIPDRDLVLPSGKKLTMMNPDYMVRELNEDMTELDGSKVNVTSLNPIRPENLPDAWERKALEELDQGVAEVSEIVASGHEEYLRLMRPLLTCESCLKCHGHQGYKVGDLRGGAGVSIPLNTLKAVSREINLRQLCLHLGLYMLGLVGILTWSRLLTKGLKEKEKMASGLQQALQATDALIDNVPFGIVLVGRDKVVRRANRTALAIMGKDEDEVVSYRCHKNICPALEDQCPILDMGQEMDNSARKVLGPDGRKVPILKTVIPYNYQGEEVLLEAFVDTTEQTRKSDDLLATLQELKQFNRLAVGRELRMTELKNEVNVLLDELKRQPRYESGKISVPGGGS
ncbi:MAG: DUF3365 domain-containing protein, partial [Gemmatimonadales bacterium]|nr:DUF3365 domain-containing protein [Gemmatimonadales bacterium]